MTAATPILIKAPITRQVRRVVQSFGGALALLLSSVAVAPGVFSEFEVPAVMVLVLLGSNVAKEVVVHIGVEMLLLLSVAATVRLAIELRDLDAEERRLIAATEATSGVYVVVMLVAGVYPGRVLALPVAQSGVTTGPGPVLESEVVTVLSAHGMVVEKW